MKRVFAIDPFLPDTKTIGAQTFGTGIAMLMGGLPRAKLEKLKSSKIDMDITQIQESHSTVRIMLEADAK